MCGHRDQKQITHEESNIKQYIVHEKFKNTTKPDVNDIMLLIMKVPFNHVQTFPKLYGCESLFKNAKTTNHKGLKLFGISCANKQMDGYKTNPEKTTKVIVAKEFTINGLYGSRTWCQRKTRKLAVNK